jgi:hypothetical protein
LVFVLGHFLGFSVLVATLMFFLVGRVLGKRKQGLFGPPSGGEEGLEFGYCFDVRHHSGFILSCATLTIVSGLHSSIPTRMDFSLRPAILAVATHCAGLLGLKPFRKHNVPDGLELLFRHHIPRI